MLPRNAVPTRTKTTSEALSPFIFQLEPVRFHQTRTAAPRAHSGSDVSDRNTSRAFATTIDPMSRLLPSHLHRAGPATPGKPEFRLSVLSWNLSGVTASALEASRTDLVLFREFVGRIVCLARPGPTVDSSDVVQFGFQEILLFDSKRGISRPE